MAEKRYHADWAKAKSRELVRDMIKRTLLTFRRPRDLRVLCLPGIDAQEVLEVYDTLGIPRDNITGLEIDSRTASGLSAKKLGIHVLNSSAYDYVQDAKRLNFDVVSLDYCGPFSDEQSQTISAIADKVQSNNFVFHQNNLIKRDSASQANYLMGYASASLNGRDLSTLPLDNLQQLVEETAETFFEDEEMRKEIKSEGLSKDILDHFHFLYRNNYDRMLKFPYAQKPEEAVVDLVNILSKVASAAVEIDLYRPIASLYEKYGNNPMIPIAMKKAIQMKLEDRVKKLGIPEVNAEGIALLIHWGINIAERNFQEFFPGDRTRYSYVSETGAPMNGDILFMRKPVHYLDSTRELMAYLKYPDGLTIENTEKFMELIRKTNKTRTAFWRKIDSNSHSYEGEREFLGNSSRPVLTKKRFIEELEAGHDIAYVKEHYRGYESKPLPQWQAHYTMGTYSSKELADETPDDRGLEKITKEQAVDLISSGIPLDEIHATYPTSFSLGQLRAYKAHITMGSYQDEAKSA